MSDLLPLRLKLEKALVAFVNARKTDYPRLRSLAVVAGHSAGEPALPYLVVHVPSTAPHPEMPDETAVRDATITLLLKTEAHDEARRKADVRLEDLETLLMEPLDNDAPYSDANPPFGLLLATLNIPPIVEGEEEDWEDLRPAELRRFHAYAIERTDDSVAAEGAAWLDTLSFTCVCQPMDSHEPPEP